MNWINKKISIDLEQLKWQASERVGCCERERMSSGTSCLVGVVNITLP